MSPPKKNARLELLLQQGDFRRARELGRKLLSSSSTLHRAEAHVVLGKIDEAARLYEQLASETKDTIVLAESRHQAALLAEAAGLPRDQFKTAFPPLQLIVFSGHLPDRKGDPVRFPLSVIDAVRKSIRAKLIELKARVGLVSAAAGGDLLFIDELLARPGAAVHLVLPWSQEEFRRTSVLPYERRGSNWNALFNSALKRQKTLREIGQVYEPGGDAGWQYSVEVTAGIALNMAHAAHLDVLPLVLWDGREGRGVGGTGSFQAFWDRQLGLKPVHIELPVKSRSQVVVSATERVERRILHQEVKSILFADIVGYSKLTEAVIPEFVSSFLTRISQLVASSRHAPMHVNTWGDAVFAVFDFARDAAAFALELNTLVEQGHEEWLAKGLYSDQGALRLRIALHAGPVLMHYEPITRQLGFTGAHVTRAARMEPVGVPGEVVASEEFAALLEVSAAIRRREGGARDWFACEYAGSMPLAKGYPGQHHIYRVVARREPMIETLAMGIHRSYNKLTKSRVKWEDLTEDLRDANRAQAADYPEKLRYLGWELTAGRGARATTAIKMTRTQLEELAIREHDRWMAERKHQGWTYAATRDNARKHHPSLVPWSELPDKEKKKDRDAVKNVPGHIDRAGLRVRQYR